MYNNNLNFLFTDYNKTQKNNCAINKKSIKLCNCFHFGSGWMIV